MSIVERIRLDDSQYQAGWTRADNRVKRSTSLHRAQLGQVRSQYQKTGASATAFGRATVKAGQMIKMALGGLALGAVLSLGLALRNLSQRERNFNQAMNESLAIMGKVTQAQRVQMERIARKASRELNISLEESARSYFYLASAGYDAEQSMASMEQVATFAKAGMFDMATATDLATDAQSALGMTVKDSNENLENTKRITDVLVRANTLANATVEQFAYALTREAGSALKSYNKDVEEGVAVLSAFADQGIKGELAGRGLSRIIRLLTKASNDNKKEMAELGIEVFNAQGNMRNLGDIIADLEDAFEGMTDEERSASLESIGFQARMQGMILPIIGTSDAIKQYEEQLRNASGFTEKVAQKQLQSLTERWGKMKKAVQDAIGPWLLERLKDATDALEEFGESIGKVYSRFANSDAERLLNVLEDLDAPTAMLDQVRGQIALADAREIKNRLEKELGELTIPIGVETKTTTKKFSDFFTELSRSIASSSGIEWVSSDALSMMEAFDEFGFVEEKFDPQKVDEYRQQIKDLYKQIREMSEFQLDLDEGTKERENVTLYIEKLFEMRSALSEGVWQFEQMELAEKAFQEQLNGTTQETDEATDSQKKNNEAQKEAVDIARKQKAILAETDLEVQRFEDRDPMKLFSAGEKGVGVQDFLNDITRLQNQLATGIINEDEFEKEARVLAKSWKGALMGIYQSLDDIGVLTPKLEKQFQKSFKKIENYLEDSEESSGGFNENLEAIADGIDGIRMLGREFDFFSEGLQDSLDATSVLIRNLQKVNDLADKGKLGSIGGVTSMIGAIGAGISIVSSIAGAFGNNSQQKAMKELTKALRENARDIKNSIDKLLESGRIGENISGESAEEGRQLFSDFMEDFNEINQEIMRLREMLRNESDPQRRDQIKEALAGLEFGEGGALANQFESMINNLIDAGVLEESLGNKFIEMLNTMMDRGTNPLNAIQQIISGSAEGLDEGLQQLIEALTGNVGGFSDSISGAIEKMRFFADFMGVDMVQQFDLFMSHLLNNVDGFSDEVLSLLKEASKLDIGTEEGQKRLQEIIKTIAESEAFGGLTPAQIEEMLSTMQGFTDGDSGESSSKYSTGVQVARSITEIQANEVVSLLFSLLLTAKDIEAILSTNNNLNGLEPKFVVDPIQIDKKINVDLKMFNEGGATIQQDEIPKIMEKVRIGLEQGAIRGY